MDGSGGLDHRSMKYSEFQAGRLYAQEQFVNFPQNLLIQETNVAVSQ